MINLQPYKICFIDEEVAQRSHFYHQFKDEFEITTPEPPNDIEDIPLFFSDLFSSGVDMFIVDFSMIEILGYNADLLEQELLKMNPHFPFLITTSAIQDAFNHIDNPNIVYDKATRNKEENGIDKNQDLINFKNKIKKIIEKYKYTKEKYELVEENLNEKFIKGELSTEEEDSFIKAIQFLMEIEGNKTPISYFTKSTNNKLDKLIEETEKLLNKFEKKCIH